MAGIDVIANPKAVRRIIGIAWQYASVEPVMSGRENLEMVGRLFGLHKREVKVAAGAVLEQLGLADAGDRGRWCEGFLINVDGIGLRRPTLDEVFLALTGQPADSAATEPTQDAVTPQMST